MAPVRGGNVFTLLAEARLFFPEMLAAIESSHRYILAEFYLVESGDIAELFTSAFARAAARGVRVRVIFDGFGARGFSQADRSRLQAAGVELVFFNRPGWHAFPRLLVRDHRKLLLVDGSVGFTGGAGLSDLFSPGARPESYWRDCMVKIAGPVLADWHALFSGTWKRSTGRELDVRADVLAPDPVGALGRVAASAGLGTKEIGREVLKRVRKARFRVWIATAYFWPSSELRRALRRAARRGVDVRLLLPNSLTDAPVIRGVGRLFYEHLLRANVVIYEYQRSFVHTKVVLCDDWVSMGSSNLDRWGRLWNLEANQEIDSPAFAAEVQRMLERQFDGSTILRKVGDVTHHWSVAFWRLLTRAILTWSTRAATRLRRR